MRRPRLLTCLLAVTFLVAGCGDDDEPEATATSETSETTETSEPTTTDTAAEGVRVEVKISGGSVDGPGRVEASLGDEVAVTVTSDVADEVHVHGIDEEFAIEAGQATTFSFTADIPGVYEVEVHSSGALLFELAVR